MTVLPAGDLDIGPSNATLRLRTFRQGLAAKAGHDLLLEAAEWHGRIHVPAEPGASPTVQVEIDMRRLEVLQGTGGVKPLSEGDKAEIRKAMQKTLRTDSHPLATFTSSSVRMDGDNATVTGDLTLVGQSHPFDVQLRRGPDGSISGSAKVVQTAWGIKPYVGFFGALKLRDAVDVEIEAHLSI